MKDNWYKITYSEDPKTMDQTILQTDKESLKNLTSQLVKIVESESDETKYEIKYSEDQDFEEVPFQHIHYIKKPKEPNQHIVSFKTKVATIVVPLLVLIMLLLMLYGLRKSYF